MQVAVLETKISKDPKESLCAVKKDGISIHILHLQQQKNHQEQHQRPQMNPFHNIHEPQPNVTLTPHARPLHLVVTARKKKMCGCVTIDLPHFVGHCHYWTRQVVTLCEWKGTENFK
jgi:hypothetical protein